MCVFGDLQGEQAAETCLYLGVSSQGAWYYPWLPHSLALRYWPHCITYKHVGFSLETPTRLTPRTWVSVYQLLWNTCVNRSFTHIFFLSFLFCFLYQDRIFLCDGVLDALELAL